MDSCASGYRESWASGPPGLCAKAHTPAQEYGRFSDCLYAIARRPVDLAEPGCSEAETHGCVCFSDIDQGQGTRCQSPADCPPSSLYGSP